MLKSQEICCGMGKLHGYRIKKSERIMLTNCLCEGSMAD